MSIEQSAIALQKRRWHQYSLRTLLLVVTGICIAVGYAAWAIKSERRYPSKNQAFGNVDFGIHSTYCAGPWIPETLVYAFANSNKIKLTTTNFCPSEPERTGIHWWMNGPDGLWINGEKVQLSKIGRVFAILDDGKIVPISLTDAELDVLTQGDGINTDTQLKQKFTAAFQTSTASQ